MSRLAHLLGTFNEELQPFKLGLLERTQSHAWLLVAQPPGALEDLSRELEQPTILLLQPRFVLGAFARADAGDISSDLPDAFKQMGVLTPTAETEPRGEQHAQL